jgi:hypothetical protein
MLDSDQLPLFNCLLATLTMAVPILRAARIGDIDHQGRKLVSGCVFIMTMAMAWPARNTPGF